MNVRAFLFAAIFALMNLALFSCSTYSKKDCEHFNWENIGYDLGYVGERTDQDRFEHFQKECGDEHGIHPIREQMDSGFKTGLQNYCSPQGAKRAGATGLSYRNVCPAQQEEEFMRAYKPERYNWLENEIIRLGYEIKSKNVRISSLESEVTQLRSQVSSLQSEVASARASCLGR